MEAMAEQVEYEKLKNLSLFKDLTDAELDTVSRRIFEKDYKKGSTLFMEGMPGEVLYIVTEGAVEITKKARDREVAVTKIMPGEIVGEMSLIDSGTRTATGRTAADSKLIIITKRAFNEMLDSDPAIAAKILMALLKVINKRLRITDKKFEEI
jgi:CRP/FNR family transcriptional regulator, cyclic AMP receptor protein